MTTVLGHDTSRLEMSLVAVPTDLVLLDAWIDAKEDAARYDGLKDDNEARVVWATPDQPSRTRYAFVYLHGFSASQGDAAPLHRQLAAEYGANLYLARLPRHGLSNRAALAGVTAQEFIDAACEALAVGQRLGDRVILVGSSLGASLALYLASQRTAVVAALVLWSPGIRPYNAAALDAICRTDGILDLHFDDDDAARRRYWSRTIHRDGYRAMAHFFDECMQTVSFSKVLCPCFLGCYYQDETRQDFTASVSAMMEMMHALGTPENKKRVVAFPDGAHALGAPSRSAASADVLSATLAFLQDIVEKRSV